MPINGFRQGKLNYVWIFTTGLWVLSNWIRKHWIYCSILRPTDNGYQNQLAALSRIGVRVQAIGLGNVTDAYLNTFGYNSIASRNYNSPLFGIAHVQNNQLSSYLYQTSTASGILLLFCCFDQTICVFNFYSFFQHHQFHHYRESMPILLLQSMYHQHRLMHPTLLLWNIFWAIGLHYRQYRHRLHKSPSSYLMVRWPMEFFWVMEIQLWY